MRKHCIAYLLFLIILLVCSCEGFFSPGWDFECRAINVTTLFENGVSVDTFNFYDTQYEGGAHKRSIKEKKYKKDSLFLSRDSVLKFFRTEEEYYNQEWYFNDKDIIGRRRGLIVECDDNNPAGTLFITPEGYKLLELCDYDSVTMFYTFITYPE